MGLRGRLHRLENRPEAKECPECRLSPGDPGYIVYSEEGQSREQEWCPACGEPRYFIIRVAYDDSEGEEAARPGDITWP